MLGVAALWITSLPPSSGPRQKQASSQNIVVSKLSQYSPSQACILVGIIEEKFTLRAAVSVVQIFRHASNSV